MNSFGVRLRELRQMNKLTMLELGGKIGIAKSTIAGYESGFREPSLRIVIALAKQLEVSADYLLGISNYPTIVDFFTPINESASLDTNALHWDGVALDDEELEEVKKLLELVINKKEVQLTGSM